MHPKVLLLRIMRIPVVKISMQYPVEMSAGDIILRNPNYDHLPYLQYTMFCFFVCPNDKIKRREEIRNASPTVKVFST